MIDHIITSTLLILFLLLLSALLEKRIDPCLKYALWLLAVVKLLIPLPAFETHMSVLNLVDQTALESGGTGYRPGAHTGTALTQSGNPDASISDQNLEQNALDQKNSDQKNSDPNNLNQNALNPAFWDQNASDQQTAPISFFQISVILTALWIAGILLCGGIFLWSAVRFRSWLRHDRILTGRYIDKLPIFEIDGLGTPCLTGLFAPAIYVDRKAHFDEEQLAYILAHEYTHFRHRDHLWTVVRCICICIYWYNPFVWLAAYRSANDCELACDAGTLKRIGEENHIQYARTLILAAEMLSQTPGMRMAGYRTGAAGGMQEMKKRIRLLKNRPRTRIATLAATLVLCCGIVGCTYGSAVHDGGTQDPPGLTDDAQPDPPVTRTDTEALTNAEINTEIHIENTMAESETEISTETAAGLDAETAADPESMVYHGITLYADPESDQVCIGVQPSELRDHMEYFYIPSGDVQRRLISLMEQTKPDWQDDGDLSVIVKKGLKETGYELYYKGYAYTVFEGGYLYTTDPDPEHDFAESLVRNEALCNLVQQTLSDELGYEQVDITQIHDIVSAKLNVRSIFTDWKFYSQTITDQKILALFEDWFSNATYILWGAGCGNENACLELTLADGNVIRLSMATDSCPNFGVNGVYYDYRPKASWGNTEFYQYFDEIPFTF